MHNKSINFINGYLFILSSFYNLYIFIYNI